VIDADRAASISLRAARLQNVEVHERKPMVFSVVGQKRQRWILMLNLGVEDGLVPTQHLFEAACAVDDVDELGRSDARHEASSRSCRWVRSFGIDRVSRRRRGL